MFIPLEFFIILTATGINSLSEISHYHLILSNPFENSSSLFFKSTIAVKVSVPYSPFCKRAVVIAIASSEEAISFIKVMTPHFHNPFRHTF